MYSYLRLDYETRSALKLGATGTCKICGTGCKGHGAHAYAEHWSTDIICAAVKPDAYQSMVWVADWAMAKIKPLLDADPNPPLIINTDQLNGFIQASARVEAHNSPFDSVIHHHKAGAHGITPIPLDKWECSMSKALYLNLPGSLEELAKVIGAPVQKDMVGSAAMKKVCQPRNPTVVDKAMYPDDWEKRIFWEEDPQLLYTTVKYCVTDIETQYWCSEYCGPLPEYERKIWLLDQTINNRGVLVDTELAEAAEGMASIEKQEINDKFQELLAKHNPEGIKVVSPSSHKAFCKWVNSHGIETDSVGKEVVEKLIENGEVPPWMIPILRLRQDYTKSSSSKYSAAKRRASADGRLRGEFGYAKAGTNRWASLGLQLHNMPSRGLINNAHKLVDLIRFKMVQAVLMVYGSLMMLLKSCIRSMFKAGPGNKFICGDFSSIEGRVLAWLAFEDDILQAYRDGMCAYRLAAMGIFGVAYDAVTKAQRQIGKVIELACGYQGWLGAFHSMAANYGVEVEDDVAQDAIGKWRKARWRTKKLWADTEDAAIHTVQTGQPTTVGRYSFRIERRWLVCDLPSGRSIYYFDPRVSMTTTKYGRTKMALSYWGIKEGKWKRIWTYGGKLVENITQAISRDLLSEAMIDLEAEKYPIVLHVHDEACAEVPVVVAGMPDVNVGFGTTEHFEEVMGRPRAWAPGLPLKVEAWEGLRYRK